MLVDVGIYVLELLDCTLSILARNYTKIINFYDSLIKRVRNMLQNCALIVKLDCKVLFVIQEDDFDLGNSFTGRKETVTRL